VNVFWTDLALEDRHTIYGYIERDSRSAALAMDMLFSAAALKLATHPTIGRMGRVAKTRELVLHKNYVVVYDIEGDAVRILRILHAAKMWPQAKS
jgi:toxin ParE1/3/4